MPALRAYDSPLTTGAAGIRSRGWDALPKSYAIPEIAPQLQDAQLYCERLARSHYENFSVATWFLPKQLRQHFFNIYAYCRISDDLGDEVGDPVQSLVLLDEWQAELDRCYAGTPRHPVFVALRETVRALDIPKQPFADLLIAFRQDQTTTRYPTFDDLLGYCRYSANPVGHLVLYVCGYRDAERQQLSDCTCTALQLANFWQDVTVDYGKGRIYLPLENLRRFDVDESDRSLEDFADQLDEAVLGHGRLARHVVRLTERRRGSWGVAVVIARPGLFWERPAVTLRPSCIRAGCSTGPSWRRWWRRSP